MKEMVWNFCGVAVEPLKPKEPHTARKAIALTASAHHVHALADDGTMWERWPVAGDPWRQMPALPQLDTQACAVEGVSTPTVCDHVNCTIDSWGWSVSKCVHEGQCRNCGLRVVVNTHSGRWQTAVPQ